MPEPEAVIQTEKDPPLMEAPKPAATSESEAARLRQQIAYEEDIKKRTDEYAETSKKRLESLEKQQEATAPLYKEAQDLAKEREKVLKETPIPEVPQIPPPSQQAPIDKPTAELMGYVGLMISSIAGFGGRMNGIRMNTALSGFLNGYREGRYADAEFARRQWHDMFEYQIALYKMQVERTRDILGRSGMTLENKVAEINLMMAPYKDYQEGMDVREKDLATIITDLRQQEQMIQRMTEADQRIKHNEEQMAIERQRYNLDVMKYLHPERGAAAKAPTAEQDKLALAYAELGIPAGTPIGSLKPEQATKVRELMKTASAGKTGALASTSKAYADSVKEAAKREFENQLKQIGREMTAGKVGKLDRKGAMEEAQKRADKFLQENFKYKIVGRYRDWLDRTQFDVAPMFGSVSAPTAGAGEAPSGGEVEWHYDNRGNLVGPDVKK
jgi:hypothetical protein